MWESAEMTRSAMRHHATFSCRPTSKTSHVCGYFVIMETMDAVEEKVEDVMDKVADSIPAKARSFLGGDWLGHPLHPMLTDLPIGFWTGSFLLDIFGGRKSRRASAAFVGLGVASAAP